MSINVWNSSCSQLPATTTTTAYQTPTLFSFCLYFVSKVSAIPTLQRFGSISFVHMVASRAHTIQCIEDERTNETAEGKNKNTSEIIVRLSVLQWSKIYDVLFAFIAAKQTANVQSTEYDAEISLLHGLVQWIFAAFDRVHIYYIQTTALLSRLAFEIRVEYWQCWCAHVDNFLRVISSIVRRYLPAGSGTHTHIHHS